MSENLLLERVILAYGRPFVVHDCIVRLPPDKDAVIGGSHVLAVKVREVDSRWLDMSNSLVGSGTGAFRVIGYMTHEGDESKARMDAIDRAIQSLVTGSQSEERVRCDA